MPLCMTYLCHATEFVAFLSSKICLNMQAASHRSCLVYLMLLCATMSAKRMSRACLSLPAQRCHGTDQLSSMPLGTY